MPRPESSAAADNAAPWQWGHALWGGCESSPERRYPIKRPPARRTFPIAPTRGVSRRPARATDRRVGVQPDRRGCCCSSAERRRRTSRCFAGGIQPGPGASSFHLLDRTAPPTGGARWPPSMSTAGRAGEDVWRHGSTRSGRQRVALGECRSGGLAEVDRSTTERNRGHGTDNGMDKTARQGPGGHRLEAIQDLAKVGVAGSNLVVRSRKSPGGRG